MDKDLSRMFKGIDITDRTETYGFLFIDRDNKYWIITPKNTSGFFHADEVEPQSVEQIASLTDRDGWIRVEDGLPKKYKSVIMKFKGVLSRVDDKVCEGWYDGDHWDCFALLYGMNEKITVTHWQPLPAPPK